MLIPLANTPRDYAWGSTSLIARLEGREPTGEREAEVWFGDHPGDPAELPDGRTLIEWLSAEGADAGAPARLPYLLKLLGAASVLSIQAHPSKAQAEAGFAREEAAGVPADAPHRTYRDDNHKPELIVAVSDAFTALAGLRDSASSARLLRGLGAAGARVAERLDAASDDLGGVISWVLSDEARDDVAAVGEALATAGSAESAEFAAELAVARTIAAEYPGDPGVVVALLMNLVRLRRGEGLFVPAGVLHAYVEGLGVEIMAASDNVLRGGLTPKHIDAAELLSVLDARPAAPVLLSPRVGADGVAAFEPPVDDFALLRVQVDAGSREVAVTGVAIALCVAGRLVVGGADAASALRPGQALLVTPDENVLTIEGTGELFLAVPGRVR